MLEGGLDGSFRIWETHKWTDALWTSQVISQTSLCRLWQIAVSFSTMNATHRVIFPSALSAVIAQAQEYW